MAEPPAALVIELPQRDLGGQLPSWDELRTQTGWARDRGAAAHLDGARLWEAAAGYDRSPAEIAALFDTTYVSFYKGIGALPDARWPARRTSSPRSASGAAAWAAPCSACGPAPRRR